MIVPRLKGGKGQDEAAPCPDIEIQVLGNRGWELEVCGEVDLESEP